MADMETQLATRHHERKHAAQACSFNRLLCFPFFSTVVGFGMLVFVAGRTFIEGGAPQGFPFLASIIIIFGGTQLFTLGIIGEYIARVHLRTMHSPSYAVTETSNLADGG